MEQPNFNKSALDSHSFVSTDISKKPVPPHFDIDAKQFDCIKDICNFKKPLQKDIKQMTRRVSIHHSKTSNTDHVLKLKQFIDKSNVSSSQISNFADLISKSDQTSTFPMQETNLKSPLDTVYEKRAPDNQPPFTRNQQPTGLDGSSLYNSKMELNITRPRITSDGISVTD